MVHFPNAAASFCRCWSCGQSASSGDRNNYALNGVLRVRAVAATTTITATTATTTIYKCSIIVAVAVVVVVVAAIAIAVVVVAAVAVVAIVYHAQFARATIAEEMTT